MDRGGQGQKGAMSESSSRGNELETGKIQFMMND